ncbi:unnamed protein product [Phytophthora fragariaefolia]|uniref:Unnamed protein product n=1 Tax=Phytophthora fragariaefolia TaxID=1490495 RepID=A0A9W6UFD0_9STRA|nr:unnamed protein product [Phytophthora fragariaefolia]
MLSSTMYVFYKGLEANAERTKVEAASASCSPREESRSSSDTEADLLYGDTVPQLAEVTSAEASLNAKPMHYWTSGWSIVLSGLILRRCRSSAAAAASKWRSLVLLQRTQKKADTSDIHTAARELLEETKLRVPKLWMEGESWREYKNVTSERSSHADNEEEENYISRLTPQDLARPRMFREEYSFDKRMTRVKKIVDFFVARTGNPGALEPQSREILDFCWLPLDQVVARFLAILPCCRSARVVHEPRPQPPPLPDPEYLQIEGVCKIEYVDVKPTQLKNHCSATIVCIHGAPGSLRDYRYLIPMLAEQQPGLRLIALNLPGYMGSEVQKTRYLETVCALRAAEVGLQAIRQLCTPNEHDGGDVFLVGHSFGAHTVINMASMNETQRIAGAAVGILKIRGIALMAPAGCVPQRMVKEIPIKMMVFLLRSRSAVVVRWATSFVKYLYTEVLGFPRRTPTTSCVAAIVRAGTTRFPLIRAQVTLLQEANMPVFIAWALDDVLVEPEIPEELGKLSCVGPRLEFAGGGHNIQKTRVEQISASLSLWVSAIKYIEFQDRCTLEYIDISSTREECLTDKVTIVILHGDPGSYHDFRYFIPLVQRPGMRIIGINLPGYEGYTVAKSHYLESISALPTAKIALGALLQLCGEGDDDESVFMVVTPPGHRLQST